ncbi:tripartite tricarboxylate transporter permease [Silicimonas algicola]|uniref:Putative tricarboxylic transport membrane protein n=1 Tax=Silicimonas algicola TaxID=1826607 RepID=A0A316GBJ9_9RHOB|nr:tripartite tricarboxylate transporter permease [Silicimonas algicola]AZQ65985.1 tripartite tricarboxylate transporter permease [Silicimonas algicola]PWK58278.1 putative tricarboxylic transport membrane protein [Silicimonas algicola]
MEILSSLSDGILIAIQPVNILLILAGVTVGLWIGAMPGLGSVNGVAILLPITFLVPPGSAIIFLAAIYYGAMYGGAISSITLGIPGASTAVATTFDGRPLALKGQARLALIAAAIASFIGGTVANILFTAFAPLLATVALSFGPPEIFALMLLAFATFVGLGGDDIPKTIFSICFGLVLAAVGFDQITGAPRLVLFDMNGFLGGISFLVLAIGVYGIGEMLWTLNESQGSTTTSEAKMSLRGVMDDTATTFRRGWRGMSIGSSLGFFVGVLPAAGATPGALMAYGVAKMTSKNPERFGQGEVNGVTAPESANNSAASGAMLPMLTLGIPGSPTTAILLGGMVMWGLTPGPMLFVEQPEFVWGLIGSFYVSNFFALVVNLAFIPLFIWMLRMPFTVLAPLIFVLSIIGGYAATSDMFDVWLMVVFGLGAFLLRKFDYPVAPAVLAIVLGPIAEPTLRQSLLLSSGDPTIFITRPIAGPITIIALILIFLPALKYLRPSRRRPT